MMKKKKRTDARDALVGKRLRTQRLVRKMTQTQLADRIGITFQQIQKYENGTNRIGAGRLQAIAEALSVPPSFFFGTSTRASQEAVDATFKFLNTRRSLKLVSDFSSIKDSRVQTAIVGLVEMISKASR
jgi:transcriptional regulator with XRE-family HTH domain